MFLTLPTALGNNSKAHMDRYDLRSFHCSNSSAKPLPLGSKAQSCRLGIQSNTLVDYRHFGTQEWNSRLYAKIDPGVEEPGQDRFPKASPQPNSDCETQSLP